MKKIILLLVSLTVSTYTESLESSDLPEKKEKEEKKMKTTKKAKTTAMLNQYRY